MGSNLHRPTSAIPMRLSTLLLTRVCRVLSLALRVSCALSRRSAVM
jgi:hypothetical protein